MFVLFRGQLKLKEDEEGKHANLKADGKYELDTIAKGSLKTPEDTEFLATNERFNFQLNPKTQNNNSGSGTVFYYDKVCDRKLQQFTE